MTKDEEATLRRKARDARAELRELESNHNPNWKTRTWRAAGNGANLAGVYVGAGEMLNKDWGPMKANSWIGLAGEAVDIWVEHPALRTLTEFMKGLLGARVALKRSGNG